MTRRQRFVFALLIGLTLGSCFTTIKALKLARHATEVAVQALDIVDFQVDAIDWSQQDVCE